MEIKMTENDFDLLCETSTQNNDIKGCIYDRQFGRFENSLYHYAVPPVKRWKMLYWVAGHADGHIQWMFLRQFLDDRCEGYDLMWDQGNDTNEGSMVIFTDYIGPHWQKHYRKTPEIFPDEMP